MALNPVQLLVFMCLNLIILLCPQWGFTSQPPLTYQVTHTLKENYQEACHYTQDLLEIEINRMDVSTAEEPTFKFSIKMSNFQADPGDLVYRWVIHPSEGFAVSTQPVTVTELEPLILTPDEWGTYQVTLIIQDRRSGDWQCVGNVFQYPDVDQEDVELLPAIHAHSPWRVVKTEIF